MIDFLLNLPTVVYIAVMVVLVVMIIQSYLFELGETKWKGKMEGGHNVSIKKQNVTRLSGWRNNTFWLPNRRVPGMGKVPGQVVKDVWDAWFTGFAICAVLFVVLGALYLIMF